LSRKKNEEDLQAFINKSLRQILNIRWPERITNAELCRRTNETPILQTIKQRKWHRIGHILRRPQNNITKQALDWNPQGKRKKRPANDNMKEDARGGVKVYPDVMGRGQESSS
jgi:hypothetical protein